MNRRETKILLSEDGSHTLFIPQLNETYHSTKGALQESLHVYINTGYEQVLQQSTTVNVLEIGFGTGLNALLTMLRARETSQATIYHTLEPYPIDEEIWTQLNYGTVLSAQNEWISLHRSPWNTAQSINQHFVLHKEQIKLEEVVLPLRYYDVVYFDAFAPSKQSEIWDIKNLQKLYDATKEGGLLVTYSSQAQFRRNLQEVGFDVKKVKGPPGKKEMTVGSRQ